jgi:hypothetical protein
MAYSFGGGVRPELGKTDYSGYLQGALTGAQGVAAGGAAMGKGIEKLIAGAAEGVNKYMDRKETKELLETSRPRFIEAINSNPYLKAAFGNIDTKDPKAVDAAIKGFGAGDMKQGLLTGNKMIAEFGAQQAQRDEAMQNTTANNSIIRDAITSTTPINRDELFGRLLGVPGNTAEMADNATNFVIRRVDQLKDDKMRKDIDLAAAKIAKLNAETNLVGKPPPISEYEAGKLKLSNEQLELARDQFNDGKEISKYQKEQLRIADSQNDIARARLAQGEKISPTEQAQLDIANRRLNFDIDAVQAIRQDKTAKKEEIFQKEAKVAVGTIADMERLIQRIDLAQGMLANNAGGAEASMSRFLPWSAAAQLDAVYSEIIGNIVIDTLMQMKRDSPDGSTGFGQFNEKEFDSVVSSRGRLRSQDRPAIQLLNLQAQRKFYERSIKTLKDAYENKPPEGFTLIP